METLLIKDCGLQELTEEELKKYNGGALGIALVLGAAAGVAVGFLVGYAVVKRMIWLIDQL